MSLNDPRPKCPSCNRSDVRKLDGQCALCRQCSEANRSVYRFCWACRREWPSDLSTNSACTLPNCALRAALLSVKLISDSKSSAKGCPYFRVCPGCKALLTHNGTGCPNIECPHCGTYFCFRCLRKRCYGRLMVHNPLLLHEIQIMRIEGISPCKIVDNKESLTALEI